MRMDLIDDRLDVPLDHGEGRTQLVRDVREKTLSLGLAALELRAHLIERATERAQLAWPTHGHAHRVIARLDLPGGADQVPERRDDATDTACGPAGDEQEREDAEDEDEWRRRSAGGERVEERQHRGHEQRHEQREEEERGDRETHEAPHETALVRPPVGRRERLVGRPPPRTLSRRPHVVAAPARLAHARSSAKRYPTPCTVSR